MIDFRHDVKAQQYQALEDGQVVGTISYVDDGRVRIMQHTFTEPALQGQGIAGKLTRFALDDTRRVGMSVEPECPYIAAWMERHPEYTDVVA